MTSTSTTAKPDPGYRSRPLATPSATQSQIFRAEYDDEGVYFYQAYGDEIGDHALRHGRLGGPSWGASRMTWIKPSLAWMLYRSGYGRKPGQTRVLKVKLPHAAVADILRRCTLATSGKTTAAKCKSANREEPQKFSDSNAITGAGSGRVQWDPERDLYARDGRDPRKLLRDRAIQIGVAGAVSEFYVEQISSIEEVTELARLIGEAHKEKRDSEVREAVEALERSGLLPVEREYTPRCEEDVLLRLGIGIRPTHL